ncbi:hypothetical protein PCAR4_340059 [Paraburkholderia caribensis]|nr:hypothetical protein PCAR4_340059 [Paraburkholderia caribensis]
MVSRPLARLMLVLSHHRSSKESGQIVDDVDMTHGECANALLLHCTNGMPSISSTTPDGR